MARYTDIKAVIDYIKSRVDILTVITEDTGNKVTNSGTDNNFIFCPLHGEKNKPSFNINTRMQAYRCFGGCQDGGDVIKWCSVWHGLGPAEAVEYLAARFGVDIGQFVRPATRDEQIHDRQQQIFDAAVQWCHTQLMNHPSLLDWYKGDTGFTEEQIERYRVGYCPSTDMMVTFLFQSIPNLSRSEVSKLELDNAIQFSDALVYPILDVSGHSARIYTKPLNPPVGANYKYLGTSNGHPLYKKDLIFGLYQMRKSFRTNGYSIVLLEGFKAAIAAGGAAVMGTAVTEEQFQLLKSLGIRTITTCFDGDQPGYLASLKVIEELHRFRGVILKVARLPLDTQADTLIKVQGAQAFQAVIANAQLPIEFLISNKYNLSAALTLEHKYSILSDIAPIVAKMNDVEVDVNATYLANVLGVSDDSVRAYIRDIRASNTKLSNQRAEDAVLQHTMLDPTNWAKLKSALFTEDFFTSIDNQKIFMAMQRAYADFNTGITARVVIDKACALYPGEAERLTKRIEAVIASDPEYTLDAAAAMVQDLWRRRTTIKQVDELQVRMRDMNQTPLEALNKFRRVTISTLDVNDNQASDPVGVADKVHRMIHERMCSDKRIIGYDFGKSFPILNALLSGIQGGHQYVIAANQSVGKSIFALNLIDPIAIDQKIPWLWIAQEMNEEDLVMRLMSVRTGINNNRLQAGVFKDNIEYLLYRQELENYARGNLYIRKPVSGTMDEILALIEEYRFKHGIKGVVWDYMQLVVPSSDQRGMSEREVLSYASNIMTNRVAGTGLASVCIAQLNRTDYKKGEVREGESIGGAYKIMQDASDAIMLSEKTDKQIEEFGKEKGNRWINLDKRRGGASDVVLHGNLDKHDKISLKFTECVTAQEAIGFTSTLAA